MILETCNFSLSMDVKEAEESFEKLTLSSYAGENVSSVATDALKLIKIMNGSYAMGIRTGSDLLKKVSSTSSDYFNRTIFGHLDKAYRMEDKYMLKDPGLLKKDPEYSKYGPVAICGLLQDEYGRLYKAKDWPALTSSLESNNDTTISSSEDKQKRCHECGSLEHLRDKCPKLGRAPHQKSSSGGNTSSSDGNSSSTTTTNEDGDFE